MLKWNGMNSIGETFWTLIIPGKHIIEGLEIAVVVCDDGLHIGDGVISWGELEHARETRAAAKITPVRP